ncbi:MAG TPA: cation-translocating P-type ATPase [Candidatus Scatosoma pullicola]|nr:cation-translocating P-type ATPase [Candidatus Scatosoma pullicola]
MKHYLSETGDVLKEVGSSDSGLTAAEAASRLERDGKNKLAEAKKVSLFRRFLEQLINPMIIVLLAAAAINLATVIIDRVQGGNESFAEFIIIVAVVLLNAILGVVQEGKAEQAIEALKEMTASTCKVLRDGKLVAVKNEDIVVGDIVILEAGDSVPADCRILECASLKAEEAALTGESVPANKQAEVLELGDQKDIPLGDRKNMVYMGSTIVYGRARAVVVATGMQTEMGKIADILAQTKNEVTPLQKRLNKLSKVLSFIVLGICVFIFVFKLFLEMDFRFDVILDSFIIAVSLAVAAIPEGLATVVTIVLSLGMTKMAKKKAVVKRLTAVETLGCTQIICSDKTGTLTQNKMTVVDHYGDDEKLLATAMAQCSDAVLDDDSKEAKGEPTECALVNYAWKLGLNKTELDKSDPRVAEAPFDSMRKMMSTIHQTPSGVVQYTKGAPDEILKRCTHVFVDGQDIPLTEEKREEILAANKGMADRALRVLAAAYKKPDAVPSGFEPEDIEKDLTFVGMTGMIDPIRPEVKAAIVECKEAGIRPIMITGDHIDTAVAIALELGIITDKSQAITGAEIGEMSDEEFAEKIGNYSVYARVQPEHKVRIVNGWKAKGYITAMTGDGVNDAPSIKSADIGIGMGITGTDVTKGAADMVLQDDNFATIVTAVGEGRRIYDNIRKAIQFLLSSNLAEVVAVFVATMLGFTLLQPMHLLWINLITDTFPALALGMEEGERDLMKRKPRDDKEGIFAGGVGVNVVLQGIFIGFITLLSYWIGHGIESGHWALSTIGELSPDGMTMAFLTLSMTEMFHSFNVRSIRHSVFSMKKQNKYLWGAFLFSLLTTLAVIYIPGINTAFEFAAISAKEYFIALGLAITIIPFVEITKATSRLISKKKKNG